MHIRRSLVFAFKAPGGGKKLLLGGLFSLLFFLVYFPFVVMGYLMRILCDVLEGRDSRLPEWSDPAELFHEGLMPALVVLVYSGPLVLLFIAENFFSMAQGSGLAGTWVFASLQLVYFLVATFFLPISLLRLVIKNSLARAFDFGPIFGFVRANPRNLAAAWGTWLALGLGASLVGSMILVVGVFFTTFFAHVVGVHLFASAYRASTPFADDPDGEVRSSLALPPRLSR